MSQQELEAALRREGEEKARDIWKLAEDAAEQLRCDTTALLARHQQAGEARRDAEVATLFEAARSVAQRKAEQCRLNAENNLAGRLKLLAEQLLESLALGGGNDLFLALAREIPEHDWSRVVVNPRDQELARSHFPTAEIVATEQIIGGLKVENPDGRIVIINCLEKRLEHLWPEILPVMLEELRQKMEDDETVA